MTPSSNKNDRVVAAALTFICVLALLLFLFIGGLKWQRETLANVSTAEIMEPEETFYEPELLEAGEEDSPTEDAPAPGFTGQPKPAQEARIANASSVFPTERPSSATLNSFNLRSPLSTDSAMSDFREAADALAAKFNPVNGNNGKAGTSGAGADGTGISGSAKGRSFISCPKPRVTLRHRTVVKVEVTINAEGKVIKAVALGSADAEIRKKCEDAALGAKWSEKPGAQDVKGSITFTITPK